jgi:D-alanyl-D-alanine carboxypeptidase/D-alanyl-D-alanine-endopeptidase (penicillin-binding protein 4)
VLLALAALATTQPALDAILDDPKLSGALVTAYVTDSEGNELYSRNAGIRAVPGSNQKLITTAFALHTLGPDYQVPTKFWKLKDRLVIQSPGDPLLSHEAMLKVKSSLKLKKPLPVYVNQPYRPLYGPAWEWDDLPNKYAALVSAFTVDRGSFELWTKSGRLHLRPRNYGVRIQHIKGSAPAKVVYEPWKNLVTVLGKIPAGEQRMDTLALPIPDLAAASIFGPSLQFISAVPQTQPTAVFEGTTMKDLMKECLTESDNQVAEHLLLKAAGIVRADLDPYEKATTAAKTFLEETIGADKNDFRPHDGSGLSRHNFVTARGIAKILQWADSQPWKELWQDSLVKPGEGTLKKRMEGIPFVGKTGTLDAVVGLSGYVTLKDGRRVIVSIFLNHYACPTVEARDLADQFVKTLLDLGNRGTLFAYPHEHEGNSSHSRTGALNRDRLHRPDRHRSAA